MGNHDKVFGSPQAKSQSAPLYDMALDAKSSALAQARPGAVLARQPHSAGQSLLQLQRRYGNRYVQRVLALAQETDDEVARDSGISSSGEVTPDVEKSIQQERGGGQALDSSVRKQMEPALGADFSGVRVHTDRQADTLSRSLHARAFATGQDVFFRANEYRPGTSGGRELLAHELTHVVQQTGGRQVQTKLAVSQPGDRFEQEADQVARAVARSEQQFAQTGPQGGVASRQPEVDKETIRTQPEEEKDESAQMRNDAAPVARQEENEEQPAQAKFVQRQTADEEEKVQAQPEEEKDEPAPGVAPMHVARAGEKAAPAAPAPTAGPTKPAAAAAGDTPPGVVDLKTAGRSYDNLPGISAWLESKGRKKAGKVNVRFGKVTATKPVLMEKTSDGIELKKSDALPLSHPLFPNLGEGAGSLLPHLNLEAGKDISGHIGLGPQVTKASALAKQLKDHADLIGLTGLTIPEIPHLENKLENGKLHLGPAEVPVRLGKVLDGRVSVEADDERVTRLEGSVKAQIQGLASGDIELKRFEQGVVTGKGVVDVQLPKNVAGKVTVLWDGQSVSGDGMVDYKGEKLSGQVNLQVMDKKQAEKQAEQKQPAAQKAEASPAAASGKRRASTEYAVFGAGNLTFSFTDWLTGTAQVILDPKGNITVIGKITPQKEVELLPQKDYSKDLFSAQATAGYGIPVVGRIGIFGKVDLDAFAKLGPARLFDIVVEGQYSTDPKEKNNFQIMGTLNISAAAGLRLRGEAGAVAEILGHDLKAGAGINGIAGVRGYAEARPVIGYREKAAEGEDKKGEFFIRGDLEIAGQPFLTLSGDLFVEVDAPWWSPVPDKKWTWPLGDKTWPIGGTFGLNASVDYVFGSGQAPAIDFKPVEFSADKFLTDLYSDKAKASGQAAAEKAGEWREKNARNAEPPKGEKKGNAEPGKATEKPEAQPTVQAGGGKKAVKPADPDAQTAEGKTVKEYQEEARQKGGKPAGKEPGTDTAKSEAVTKDTTQQTQNVELQKGLAALNAVTERYAQSGATVDEVRGGVKSVRRKFKVFKSIEVIDGGETWDYEYVINPKHKQPGPKKKMVSPAEALPRSEFFYAPTTPASKAEAKPLTKEAMTKGAGSTSSLVAGRSEIQMLNKRLGRAGWVAMHLLNAKMGGADDPRNLIPGSQVANRVHHNWVENEAKNMLDPSRKKDKKNTLNNPADSETENMQDEQQVIMWYRAEVTEYHKPPYDMFLSKLKVEYGKYDHENDRELTKVTPLEIHSEDPAAEENQIDLNSVGPQRLRELGFPEEVVKAIRHHLNTLGPFKTIDNLTDYIERETGDADEVEVIRKFYNGGIYTLS